MELRVLHGESGRQTTDADVQGSGCPVRVQPVLHTIGAQVGEVVGRITTGRIARRERRSRTTVDVCRRTLSGMANLVRIVTQANRDALPVAEDVALGSVLPGTRKVELPVDHIAAMELSLPRALLPVLEIDASDRR